MITQNGVVINVPKSTMEHMQAHSDVDLKVVEEAVSKINLEGDFFKGAIDMGRIVGKTSCVMVNSSDNVLYFYRKNRHGRTPFVKKRKPVPTSKVVVIIKEDTKNPGYYSLITSWYGDVAPMEPWDARAKNVSQEEIEACDEFWSTHALIYDQAMIDMNRR